MSLLSINNLTCTQPRKTLFKNATFGIGPNDKVAIIGTNGSGKTTLLKLLANSVENPHEAISTQNGLRITYLAQSIEIDPKHTIRDHLFKSDTSSARAILNYNTCLEAYTNEAAPELEAAFTKAMEAMDHADAWEYEARVSSILRELDIHNLSQNMSDLSGGMRKKIALAQAFFEDSDLLILDEPTNHLDIVTIEWLESMLKRHLGAVLMVTHDRYFLDKVCTKILEIDQEKIFAYKGNYQTYLEQREQRYLDQEKHDQNIQTVLRTELAWLRRGAKARSTKQKARKDRAHELMAHKGTKRQESIELNVVGRRLGKKILEIEEVTKSFGDQQIIRPFSYIFKQGDRIGILGPNGVGKTTLLNMITETFAPDSGSIDVGVNTVFGYFDQNSQDFDLNMTIYEHMAEMGSHITMHDGTTLSASKLLERFLFPSAMLKTPIGKLSGGERRRLHLVSLLLKNPNFLLFDEPTNDLDIQTLSVLEDFLLTFKGCVIVISHDRYFMDRVVDRLFIFSRTKPIKIVAGTYSEYAEELKHETVSTKKNTPKSSVATSAEPDTKPAKKGLTNLEKEALKRLEKEIEALEAEQAMLTEQLTSSDASPELYAEVGKQLKTASQTLGQYYERWEDLAGRV